MKKLVDRIWYVCPRFPGAPFHLTCSLVCLAVFVYGIICIIQKHLH